MTFTALALSALVVAPLLALAVQMAATYPTSKTPAPGPHRGVTQAPGVRSAAAVAEPVRASYAMTKRCHGCDREVPVGSSSCHRCGVALKAFKHRGRL